jgi:hypothetical protein
MNFNGNAPVSENHCLRADAANLGRGGGGKAFGHGATYTAERPLRAVFRRFWRRVSRPPRNCELPQAIQLADVNGDGKLDIVTSCYVDEDNSVLLGNGDGTFALGTTIPVGQRATRNRPRQFLLVSISVEAIPNHARCRHPRARLASRLAPEYAVSTSDYEHGSARLDRRDSLLGIRRTEARPVAE